MVTRKHQRTACRMATGTGCPISRVPTDAESLKLGYQSIEVSSVGVLGRLRGCSTPQEWHKNDARFCFSVSFWVGGAHGQRLLIVHQPRCYFYKQNHIPRRRPLQVNAHQSRLISRGRQPPSAQASTPKSILPYVSFSGCNGLRRSAMTTRRGCYGSRLQHPVRMHVR